MKRLFSILSALAVSTAVLASANVLDLKSVANYGFYARSLGGVKPLADGEHYAQISNERNAILRFSFQTGQVVDTLFSTSNCRGCDFTRFDGYILSPQEDKILIQTKTKSIYRRSFTAEYYLYSVANKKMEPLSKGGPQQVPSFSPDGKMIAFVRDNNLFLVKLMFNNAESQITTDGVRNEVINGHADWVYEEEFSMNSFYEFSADSKMIAYVKSVEKEVPEYSFPMFKGLAPSLQDYDLYPGAYTYKYPVPGVKNSTVTVHTFDIKSTVTRQVDVPLDEDGYIPRIHFTDMKDAEGNQNQLAIVTLNRHQDRMDIYMGNARSTVCKLILREEANMGWLNEPTYQDIEWIENGFVMQSERTGHNHLYQYDLNGRLVRTLTSGNWEVTRFCGFDPKTGDAYYESCEPSPLQRAIYKVDKKGRKTAITATKGTHSGIFSKNMKYFIHSASALDEPSFTVLETTAKPLLGATLDDYKAKHANILVSNEHLKTQLTGEGMPTREFFSFTTADGITLNGWMVKPVGADLQSSAKQYPVLLYQYSGPDSQSVTDSWGNGFFGGLSYETYLAQQGIVVACVDGRGTGFRGEEFKKCTYLKLGLLEARDQAETARYLGSLPGIDAKHIAIWGWSYGGFMTLMAMSEAPVFCAGIAVAPPTCWRYYDSVYTERFMRTPGENGEGYSTASAIARAPKLEGHLLLVHGMADDNVHFRNSAEYAEALVQADKQFEMQVYTNRNHGISGGNTRYHLFQRMTNFLNRELLSK
ncbi:MAG: S9 family peptidase [Bacteroidaceae bacterium]|nr:S9 family peptidase [Bacteroidaceae bacterium]